MFNNISQKGAMGAIVGIFSYLYGCITEIVIILGILMMFDYITGVTVVIKNKGFKSLNLKIGVWGAIKKLFYGMVITTGFLIDYFVNIMSNKVNFDIDTYGTFGIVLVFYFIGNEGFSLVKNWRKLDIPLPPFLLKFFKHIKNLKIISK